jgi:hypothetical protein
MQAAEWRVESCIGFLPNLALSIHKNARQVLGDTSPGCYLLKAANTAFHDLTKWNSLPPAVTSLLGLSFKLIPAPRHSPSHSKVEPSLACIEHDIGLKTFFAGQDDGNEPSKLRAKSSWHPPLPPRTIDVQVNSFLTKVRGLFTKRRGKQNLAPHQRLLLSSIQENQSIIIAQADTNLGPVGIDIKDYIKLGLEHLLDTSTYKMLTEAQAVRDIQELQEEIYSLTVESAKLTMLLPLRQKVILIINGESLPCWGDSKCCALNYATRTVVCMHYICLCSNQVSW